MTRYRIPYHMFLKWFVPYSRGGSFLMASLFVPTLGVIALLCGVGFGSFAVMIIFQLIWGSVTLNYHRREGLARWWQAQLIALGILTAAFLATKDRRPLYASDSSTTNFFSPA